LLDYDYTTPGAYFVTIGTQNRGCLFGEILDGQLRLNELGRIVSEEWLRTAAIRSSIAIDEFIVMPNHFHGLLLINCRGTARRAPTVERFGKPVSGSLPTIIRSFKSAVTRRINQYRKTFGRLLWQRGYYERVVRNNEELNSLRKYIMDNPAQWFFDEKNPDRSNQGNQSE